MKKNKPVIPVITKDTYVIADLHFGHKNAPVFEPSRAEATTDGDFENQEEMIISRWNSVITEDDDVVILGDYAWKGIEGFTKRLNGNKILIRGNHDKRESHAYYSAGFSYVYDNVIDSMLGSSNWLLEGDDSFISAACVQIEGQAVFLSHYPVGYYEDYFTRQRHEGLTGRVEELTAISQALKATVNVHGHTHSKQVDDTDTLKYLNVSCENLDFTPIKLGELLNASGI